MATKKKKTKRLKEYRKKRGLSVAELARKSGVSEQTIRRAENDAGVRWGTVHALSNALAVHEQTLLGARDVWAPDGDWAATGEAWEERVKREERERLSEPAFREEATPTRARPRQELPACCRDEYEFGNGTYQAQDGVEVLECFRCKRRYAVTRPGAGRTA